jgi:hypothetical protein
MPQNALAGLMRQPAWNFEVPDVNNLLQPIQGGIDRYNKQAQQAVENERADQRLGMDRERLGMEKTRFQDDRVKSVVEQAGNLAMLYDPKADPDGSRWGSFIAAHEAKMRQMNPNAAPLGAEYRNPATGRALVLGDSRMALQMLQEQRARAADQRAGEALAIQRNESKARLSQDQNLPYDARVKRAETYFPNPADRVPTNSRYAQFLSTGQLAPPADPYRFVPKDSIPIAMPTQPGQQPTRVPGFEQPNKADEKFSEETAKLQTQQYAEMVGGYAATEANLGKIGIMKQLSGAIGDPGIANTIANSPVGRAARAVGLAPEQMASIESWTAMVNQMVPAQRPPGSGTMSDRDVQLFKESLPMLAATKEGRDFILAQMEGIARYDQQRAQIANEVVNGRMTRQQANDRMMRLANPLADVQQNMQRFGIRAPGAAPQQRAPAGQPQGGGLAPGAYVYDPATGQLVPAGGGGAPQQSFNAEAATRSWAANR